MLSARTKEMESNIMNHQISISEKLIWYFIRESQYMDTISLNLPESLPLVEQILVIFERYQDIQGVTENIDELFEGIQSEYFSY
jgi:hypothetical protein